MFSTERGFFEQGFFRFEVSLDSNLESNFYLIERMAYEDHQAYTYQIKYCRVARERQ